MTEPIEAFRRSTLRPLDVLDAEARLPAWTRELLDCLSTRAREAFVLRQAGLSMAQIGQHLAVSPTRASQLCAAAELRLVATARHGVARIRYTSKIPPHQCATDGICPVPPHLRELLDQPIDILDLSIRARNCFANHDVRLMGELVRRSYAHLLRIPNFGTNSLREVIARLAGVGLHPGMDVGDWKIPAVATSV